MIESPELAATPIARANDVNLHVGRRIREWRSAIGLSQTYCAKQLKLSTQQFHKYEVGQNRISAGRLYEIAAILEAPVDWFFEGLEHANLVRNPSPAFPLLLELLKTFEAITDPAKQEALSNMARQLAAPKSARRA